MTILDLTHRGSGLAERISDLIATQKAAHARRSLYRQTIRELNALSDRDLADLGMNRGMIPSVAREATAATRG